MSLVSKSSTAFLALAVVPCWAQTPAPRPTAAPPASVDGYVATLTITTTAPDLPAGQKGSPEAHAILGQLQGKTAIKTRLYLAQNLSRMEILSADSLLPPGTVVLHEAGARFYAIANPKAKTFAVLDAEGILSALEGGIGIVNSAYQAKVLHTLEKRPIGGFLCRKSTAVVTYVSAIPFENDKVYVQQTNDIEIWHTPELVSSAILDHFFFKFQRDKTGGVQKVFGQELGFPMEMKLSVSQGAAGKELAQPGSLVLEVSGVAKEKNLDSELFRIPPEGYAKVDKSPFQLAPPSGAK